MLLDVLRQVFHFAALQMNEFPAFFAFTMIRLLFTFMSAITSIFKTRTAVGGWYGTTYCKYLTKVSKNSPSSTGRH